MARRRHVNSSGINDKSDDSKVHLSQENEKSKSSTGSMDGTSYSLQGVFKTFITYILLLYIVTPFIIYFFPKITEQIVFKNWEIGFYEVSSLSKPASVHKLHGTATYYLTCEQTKLGVWHILPKQNILEYEDDLVAATNAPNNPMTKASHVIIYHHGRSQSRATGDGYHRAKLYELLRSEGYHIVTFDYEGYADSPGWPSEKAAVRNSQCVLKWVRSLVPTTAMVTFWGHSLGSSVATISAGQTFEQCGENVHSCPKINNLILEGAFTNIREGADETLPSRIFKTIYPPTLFSTLQDKCMQSCGINFKTDEHISKIKCPVLMLHAEDDHVISSKHIEKLMKIRTEMRPDQHTKLVKFRPEYEYKHTDIYKAPELLVILEEFFLNERASSESIII